MNKPTLKDILILLGFLILGFIIGAIGCGRTTSCKEQLGVDPTKVIKLLQLNAKKDVAIESRDFIIGKQNYRQAASDSFIVNNHKTTDYDLEKIKNLNDSTRAAYVDAVLKGAGKRK